MADKKEFTLSVNGVEKMPNLTKEVFVLHFIFSTRKYLF